jgi:hypothetical protein
VKVGKVGANVATASKPYVDAVASIPAASTALASTVAEKSVELGNALSTVPDQLQTAADTLTVNTNKAIEGKKLKKKRVCITRVRVWQRTRTAVYVICIFLYIYIRVRSCALNLTTVITPKLQQSVGELQQSVSSLSSGECNHHEPTCPHVHPCAHVTLRQ